MKFSQDLVNCLSWKQAQALQFMLDHEGFVAVGASGILGGKELYYVAAFTPKGYAATLSIAAGIFALIDSEQSMLAILHDVVSSGQVPPPRDWKLQELTVEQRDEVRKALTEALEYAYTADGGRQRRVVGGWVAPEVPAPIVNHDPGDEDTTPNATPYVFDKFASHGRRVSYPQPPAASLPKPDAYDNWKPAR